MDDVLTIKSRITNKSIYNNLVLEIFKYRHFENMLLILIDRQYKEWKESREEGVQLENIFSLLSDYKIIRAAVYDRAGGKDSENVRKLKQRYKGSSLFDDLCKVGKTIDSHNLAMLVKKVKADYNGFFAKIKTGDFSARPPRPRKISKTTNYTINIDQDRFSISARNIKQHKIGINLNGKMICLPFNYEGLKKILLPSQIQAVRLNFNNDNLYLEIIYIPIKMLEEQITAQNENRESYSGAIDIGITNLITLVSNKPGLRPLIISGKEFKVYNVKFNRFNAMLASDIAELSNIKSSLIKTYLKFPVIVTPIMHFSSSSLHGKNTHAIIEKFLEIIANITLEINKMISFKRFLTEKRNRFFFDKFHKISKYIVNYCKENSISEIIVSRNLAELKNNGKNNVGKNNQSFIQIPFMKLIDNIDYKSKMDNINIIEVNEAYTSKVSAYLDFIDFKYIHDLGCEDIKGWNSKAFKATQLVLERLKRNGISEESVEYNAVIDILKAEKIYFKKITFSITDDFKGSRVKRGLYKCNIKNKVFNSDCNGACNILRLGLQKEIEIELNNLSNPLKINRGIDRLLKKAV